MIYILFHSQLKQFYYSLTPYQIGCIISGENTMTRTFIQTNEFSKNWDILGFDDEDLRLLELKKTLEEVHNE